MIIKINQGLIEGGVDKSLTSGKTFYYFMGIPFAEPPVGELRFQPPIPAGKWEGVRNAKFDRERCLQLDESSGQLKGSEDCLYINVFTPELPRSNMSLKPVMVHIHGGGYYFGAGSIDVASPDHLINYDVVFVSFNYRLHILGFLNLNTASSTGNCGCKDQILALQWIRENIRFFGGDPHNVTVFGESVGASATHLLAISPLAKGLFHKAIAESGTIFTPWVREDQVEVGVQIGRKLGFRGTDPEKLVKFLKMQPAPVLTFEAMAVISTSKKDALFKTAANMIFIPSIEKFSNDAFLPDYPVNLIRTSRPVPMISGVAMKEGVTILFGNDKPESLMNLKDDLSEIVRLNVPCHPSKVLEITSKMKKFYWDPLPQHATLEQIRDKLIEIYSHLYFMHMYEINVKTTKSAAPLYIYMFSFAGRLNESLHWPMNIPGALHADESEYITLSRGLHSSGLRVEEPELTVINNLCTAWSNFALTANPNPLPTCGVHWNQFTCEEPYYMQIDEKFTLIKGKIWNEGLEFWKQIFRDYVDYSSSGNQILQL